MSSVRDIIYQALRLPRVRACLSWLDHRPMGFWLLNRLSGLKSVYPSFSAAWEACLGYKRPAHESSYLIIDGFKRSVRTRPSDYPTLFWLMKIAGTGPLRIFDFGGGSGQSFYQYRALLPQNTIAHWTVMDLPEVTKQARENSVPEDLKTMTFSTSVSDSAESNVFHAAGSFHYWEYSIGELVENAHGLPEHLIINRTPFREKGPTFQAVQRGVGWAVPCRIWNLEELTAEFSRFGFRLVDRWKVIEKSYQLPLLPDFDAPYQGLYLRRSPHISVSTTPVAQKAKVMVESDTASPTPGP